MQEEFFAPKLLMCKSTRIIKAKRLDGRLARTSMVGVAVPMMGASAAKGAIGSGKKATKRSGTGSMGNKSLKVLILVV
jgi:hypothetical protein